MTLVDYVHVSDCADYYRQMLGWESALGMDRILLT
jgi:hypothetical protein